MASLNATRNTPSARFDLPLEQTEKAQETHHEGARESVPAEHSSESHLELTDSQPSSSKYGSSTAGEDAFQPSQKADRRLTMKLDILIVPVSIMLYLSAYLDRGEK